MKVKEIIDMLNALSDEQKEMDLCTNDGWDICCPTTAKEFRTRTEKVILLD